MTDVFIQRHLWYVGENHEHTIVPQGELLNFIKPLVVLGEAGMGKSKLLARLAETPGYAYCNARKLINSDGAASLMAGAQVLVIDALDEWSSRHEGDSVDQVLRCLFKLGSPRFILSCRVADWRSATGAAAIGDFYDGGPIEMHLVPFTEADAIEMLSTRLSPDVAPLVVKHFNDRGLNGLLGNPQTLELIIRVAGSNDLPDNTGELFESAVHVLWQEHKDAKAAVQHSKVQSRDAAGAAFAALILTGSDAIARIAVPNMGDGEISITEVERLPGGNLLRAVLDTRLFSAVGADRFTYWHRRIGEFVGAGWLARHADTPRKRRRMLALFHSDGLVPASLRGIHAWLARDAALAEMVIAADPMGVIEYGDADNLTPPQGRALLQALRKLALVNPKFRDWREYSAHGLVQVALLPELKELIGSPTEPITLRALVLQVMKTSPVVTSLVSELQQALLMETNAFIIRRLAGEALAYSKADIDWQAVYAQLLAQDTEPSLRVAVELLHDVGYHRFSNACIADLVLAHCRKPHHTSGVLSALSAYFPVERVPFLLDFIASQVGEEVDDEDSRFDISYSVHRFIQRAIEADFGEPGQLWNWLRVLCANRIYSGAVNGVTDLLREKVVLRRALQKYIILDAINDEDVRSRIQLLVVRQYGLYPNDEDVAALLGTLYERNREDGRWRELVELVAHDNERGALVREAAHPFAAHDPLQMRWLDALPKQPMPAWAIQQAKQEAARLAQDLERKDQRCMRYQNRRAEVQSGTYGDLLNPALIYLGEVSDANKDLLPVERVSQWLSPDLVEDVLAGFESFLLQQPPVPTASQIAQSMSKNELWKAIFIIAAALSERLRTGRGLDDLPDERVLAGFYTTLTTSFGATPDFEDVQPALISALKQRGLWQDALRQVIEPQLLAKRHSVQGLHIALLGLQPDPEVASLLQEWLLKFKDLPITIESQFIDWLIGHGIMASLRTALYDGRAETDPEKRLMWDAVGLIVDFAAMSGRLDAAPISPDLLWQIRERLGPRHSHTTINTQLSAWIVTRFRPLYRYALHPSSSSGDMNAWDASEFLLGQVRRVGNDVSAQAIDALTLLANAPADGYTDAILAILAEQARLRVESAFRPATMENLLAVTSDTTPVSSADLQIYMLEELEVVQRKIHSDDTDSWRGFFDDEGHPHGEERCRDYLMGLLRQSLSGVALAPEAHVASDKRVDIACEAGVLRMPIEVKGQWHADLWHAADSQLGKLYAPDWRAEGHGVYLVLWFGRKVPTSKRLKSAGRGIRAPASACELEAMLQARCQGAGEGRLSVVVLDIERSG